MGAKNSRRYVPILTRSLLCSCWLLAPDFAEKPFSDEKLGGALLQTGDVRAPSRESDKPDSDSRILNPIRPASSSVVTRLLTPDS